MKRALSKLPRGAGELVAVRFLLYLGVQAAYFIGIIGTLSYELDASTAALSVGVGVFNLGMILGNVVGGSLLDLRGPKVHTVLTIALEVASCALFQLVEPTVETTLVMGAVFGLACGMGYAYLSAYPAYLTRRSGELQRVNALLSVVSNTAIMVGPLLGGVIAAYLPSQRVFVSSAVFALAAIVPALLLLRQVQVLERAGAVPVAERAGEPEDPGRFVDSARIVLGSASLSLLFWVGALAYAGFGAFDPLESLYYRDVLSVDISWMGWLSSAAGVGSVVGSALALRFPSRFVRVRVLLGFIALQGVACLLYVGTPYVAAALVGQVLLGCSFGMVMPLQNTLVQTIAPKKLIGRVNSVMNVGFSGAGAVPLVFAPALAELLSVQGVLIAASLCVLVVPLLVLAFGPRPEDAHPEDARACAAAKVRSRNGNI